MICERIVRMPLRKFIGFLILTVIFAALFISISLDTGFLWASVIILISIILALAIVIAINLIDGDD